MPTKVPVIVFDFADETDARFQIRMSDPAHTDPNLRGPSPTEGQLFIAARELQAIAERVQGRRLDTQIKVKEVPA